MNYNKFASLYWFISGMILWTVIFIMAFTNKTLHINDWFTIPSIFLIGIYILSLLVKWGLMDSIGTKIRNAGVSSTSANMRKEKLGLERNEKIDRIQFRKNMEKKSPKPTILGILFYGCMLMLGILI